MDNLGSYKRRTIRTAMRTADAKLLFLRLLPDLNPIEQLFAKLKTPPPQRSPNESSKLLGSAPSKS
jgi:transposase